MAILVPIYARTTMDDFDDDFDDAYGTFDEVPCPHCGVDIPDDVARCPQCGEQVIPETSTQGGGPWGCVVGLVGVGVAVIAMVLS